MRRDSDSYLSVSCFLRRLDLPLGTSQDLSYHHHHVDTPRRTDVVLLSLSMPLVKIFGLTGGKSIPLVPLQKAICDIFNNTPAQTKVIKTRVDGWTEEVV